MLGADRGVLEACNPDEDMTTEMRVPLLEVCEELRVVLKEINNILQNLEVFQDKLSKTKSYATVKKLLAEHHKIGEEITSYNSCMKEYNRKVTQYLSNFLDTKLLEEELMMLEDCLTEVNQIWKEQENQLKYIYTGEAGV
jgi:ribulose bisphosphate carboxylase small subunit